MTRLRRGVLVGAGLALALGATSCAAPAAAPGPDSRTEQDVLQDQDGAALGGFAALPRTAVVPSEEVLIDACVPRSGPPYQLGVIGSFSGGGLTIVDGVTVSDIRGRFCGVATVVPPPPERPEAKVCAQLTVPVTADAAGVRFDDLSTTLQLIPGVSTVIGNVAVRPEEFSAFVCDDQEPGPISLSTTILASAAPQLFGTSCDVGPLVAEVTGSLSGPLRELRGRLTSDPFRVQAVQASPTCPRGLADNTNAILGLPIEESVTGLTLDVVAQVYRPADPLDSQGR